MIFYLVLADATLVYIITQSKRTATELQELKEDF